MGDVTLSGKTVSAVLRDPGRISLRRGDLPAWPVWLMLAGFPAFWALGAAPFYAPAVAAVMAFLMLGRGGIQVPPGLLPWFAFLVWVMAAAVMVPSAGQAIGWAQRSADLVSVGIAMLYYVNGRESFGRETVIRGFLVIWVAIVVLGLLAIQFPTVRLNTPVGALLPGSLTSNELVTELVFPRLAEVQQPWGAAEPFNRPSAPFPYTNSWGVAFTLLVPVCLYVATRTSSRWVRLALVVLLGLALWPALETSNRGMLLALSVVLAYVMVRMAFGGRMLTAAAIAAAGGAAAVAILSSGALARILARQEVSDSTGTRTEVYLATFKATLESPLLGWGNPQGDVTIGIALGTQGYMWTLMYSYGFVGLGLFLTFLMGALVRTWRLAAPEDAWLHGVLVGGCVMIPFYGLGVVQLTIVTLTAAVLLRERSERQAAGQSR